MESQSLPSNHAPDLNTVAVNIPDELDFFNDPEIQQIAEEAFSAIAYLTPINHPASKVFSRTIGYLQEHKQEPAFRRICVQCSQPEEAWPGRRYGPPGHYVLSRHVDKLPQRPPDGWIVGTSSAPMDTALDLRFDFPLIVPNETLQQLSGRVLHFRFAQSGILMLQNLTKDHTVNMISDNGTWLQLSPGQQHGICQDVTMIQVLDMVFRFEYQLWMKQDELEWQIMQRNQFLHDHCGFKMPISPVWPFSSIPPYKRHGDLVVCNKLGAGGYGIVSQGVDIVTGEYIAVKSFLPDRTTKESVLNEAKIGMMATADEGLLPTLKALCQHGKHPQACLKSGPDEYFLSFPMASFDFANTQFSRLDDRTKLKLFFDTLKGLRSMHARNIMHRDVSMRNMMVLSVEPMKGVMCDFGRSTEKLWDSDPILGPRGTVAPEVSGVHDYNNKIDAWSWAYAVACLIGYDMSGSNQRMTRARHEDVLQQIYLIGLLEPVFEDLVELLQRMLEWDQHHRTSITEACRHRCWLGFEQEG